MPADPREALDVLAGSDQLAVGLLILADGGLVPDVVGDLAQRVDEALRIRLGAGLAAGAHLGHPFEHLALLVSVERGEDDDQRVGSGRAHQSQPSNPHQLFKSCSAANSSTPSSRTIAGRAALMNSTSPAKW